MKIKLDENLPHDLVALLAAKGHDVHTVQDEALVGFGDDQLFMAALREARFPITQDLDFADVRKFRPGSHAGILLIRLREPSRRRLIARVEEILQSEEISSWIGCFVVLGEKKLRVRRP